MEYVIALGTFVGVVFFVRWWRSRDDGSPTPGSGGSRNGSDRPRPSKK